MSDQLTALMQALSQANASSSNNLMGLLDLKSRKKRQELQAKQMRGDRVMQGIQAGLQAADMGLGLWSEGKNRNQQHEQFTDAQAQEADLAKRQRLLESARITEGARQFNIAQQNAVDQFNTGEDNLNNRNAQGLQNNLDVAGVQGETARDVEGIRGANDILLEGRRGENAIGQATHEYNLEDRLSANQMTRETARIDDLAGQGGVKSAQVGGQGVTFEGNDGQLKALAETWGATLNEMTSDYLDRLEFENIELDPVTQLPDKNSMIDYMMSVATEEGWPLPDRVALETMELSQVQNELGNMLNRSEKAALIRQEVFDTRVTQMYGDAVPPGLQQAWDTWARGYFGFSSRGNEEAAAPAPVADDWTPIVAQRAPDPVPGPVTKPVTPPATGSTENPTGVGIPVATQQALSNELGEGLYRAYSDGFNKYWISALNTGDPTSALQGAANAVKEYTSLMNDDALTTRIDERRLTSTEQRRIDQLIETLTEYKAAAGANFPDPAVLERMKYWGENNNLIQDFNENFSRTFEDLPSRFGEWLRGTRQ